MLSVHTHTHMANVQASTAITHTLRNTPNPAARIEIYELAHTSPSLNRTAKNNFVEQY